MNSFPSTTNDGITPDKYISYIYLNGSSGLDIPLNDAKLNTKLSYTVMLWMKPQDANFGKNYQYAVSFDNSLECYFSGTEQLICESDNQGSRLRVSTNEMSLNQWNHITVAGNPNAKSYLQLDQNGKHNIASDSQNYLNLQQKSSPWRVCIGGCTSDYVFVGGLREFKFFTTYINETQASILKNHYMLWDSQILAYYRFSESDILGNEITFRKAQITSDTYQALRDYSINDICHPITNYLSLYKFKTTEDFKTLKLDGRYNPSLTNWGYTLSMWLQLNSTTCYQSNPTLAKSQGCYILLLEDAFMIFSPSPNQIAAYFFNIKAYYQYQTRSITVPFNQWFNLQFVASQYIGYEFRVYDILGRYMANTTESRNLQEVKVSTKQLQVFSQFNGIVKNLILYTSRKTLPLSLPYVDFTAADPYIVSNDCLVYFEFQKQFVFSDNPLQIKNLCRHSQYGMLHMSFNNIDDDYVGTYWKTYPQPTNDGLINSDPKFDGVACEDGDVILEMKQKSSTISTNSAKSIPSQPNVTVEFWFKTSLPVIQTQYLMSLWGRIRAKEYFSIFFDNVQNKKLICAPFGFLSTSSPIVKFDNFTDNNKGNSGWFHLACQYEQLKEIVGYLYNANNVEDRVVTSLSSNNLVMQPDTYDIYVGNDASLNYATIGTRFKEVRFWANKRTQEDIKYWRFRQLDPKLYSIDQLLIYLRLNEGGFKEFNAASLINESLTYPVVAFLEVGYESDSELTICPSSTFLSLTDRQCYLNPVQYIENAIYPVFDSSNSTLSWLFSGEESIMMDSSVASQIRTKWIFDDQNTQAITTKNAWYQNGVDLQVPSTLFKDGSSYNVRLNFSNTDLSYVGYKDLKFVPKSCQYYIMSGSNAYQNYLNYSQPQSKYNMTFTMNPITLKSYCNEVSFYNQLNKVSYKFTPPLTSTPNLEILINQDQTITVNIPIKEQAKFPLQTNVSIIFNLQYENNYYLQQGIIGQNNQSPEKTFQNVRQTIYFNVIGQTLSTTLTSNSTNVYNKQGVQLQASTVISNSDASDYGRLTYKWVCPLFIRSLCPTTNSSQLSITSDQFLANNGVFDSLYTFQINVTYKDVQNQDNHDLQSIQIKWTNMDSPEFKIIAPNPVLTSVDNQSFIIQFDSYPTLQEIPSTISIIWSIVPNISSNNYMITDSSTHLTVRIRGFATSTQYTISATAYNQNGTNTIQRYNFIQFTTGVPPFGGSVNISPFIGYVGETNMTVSILNWQSSNRPIKYKVWSTTNSGGDTPNLALSNEWTPETQTFRFVPTDTNPYQIQISDNSGESVFVKNTPAVTNRQSSDSGNIINLIQQQQKLQIILETQSIQDKYDSLTQFATNELNIGLSSNNSNETSDSLHSTEILAKQQTRITIVDSIQNDTQSVLEQLQSESDSSIVSKGALKVINVILDDTTSLNTELIQKTVNIIKSILQQDQGIVNSLLRDQNFLTNFANSISSLMNYDKQQASSHRLLQQDLISNVKEQTRQLKAVLENQLCSDSIENLPSSKIQTSAFNLVVQKFSLDTPQIIENFKFTEDNVSGINFNIQNIAKSLKHETSSILDTFCVISTFLKIPNNLQNSQFQEQYSRQTVEYQIQNTRTKQTYDPTIYTPQDNIEIEFQITPSTFKHNQTICMVFSQNDNLWSGDKCITIIDKDRVSLKCQCSNIDSNQYNVINDYSRLLASEIIFNNVPKINDYNTISQQYIEIENTFSFFIMASFLLIVMFGLPVLSIILDKRDFQFSKQKELDQQTTKILNKLSKLSDKPLKYWIMRNIEVQETILGSKSQISLILQEIHPIINLLVKYSVEQPRIIRFATFLIQVSIFALIVTLAFNPNYRHGDGTRIEHALDQYDIRSIIGFGFLGTVLLIPASFLTKLFERRIISKAFANQNKPQPVQNCCNEQNTIQISPDKVLQTNQNILKKKVSLTLNNQRGSQQIVEQIDEEDFKFSHKCKALFYIYLGIGYILSITCIALSFVYATQMPVSNQYCMVASFYVGLVGSIMITNLARALINSLLINYYDKSKGCFKFILKLILARDTINAYKTKKLILDAANHKESQLRKISNEKILQVNKQLHENIAVNNSTSRNLNGNIYSLSRGISVDATKLYIDFQKPEISQINHELDFQNDSLCTHQLQEIHQEDSHSKSLSPDQIRNSQVRIEIEDIDCNLNSSVDIRSETLESNNMRSSSPINSKNEMDFIQGTSSRGLFGSLMRDIGNKSVNKTRQFQTNRNGSPKKSTQMEGGNCNLSGELKIYTQITMQNQSQDFMNYDETKRMESL